MPRATSSLWGTRRHLTEVLRAAAGHEGAALVEIYQNCPVFNDGAFSALTDKDVKDDNQIRLQPGEPIAETPTGPTPIGIFRDVQRPVYRQRGAAEPQPRLSSRTC